MDVKAVIKERGWTQTDVAKKMDINRVNLAASINGNPKVSTLRTIAQIIGCDVADFFRDEISTNEETPTNNTITCPHCGKAITFSKKE